MYDTHSLQFLGMPQFSQDKAVGRLKQWVGHSKRKLKISKTFTLSNKTKKIPKLIQNKEITITNKQKNNNC